MKAETKNQKNTEVKNEPLKLNFKRTLFIGLAFFTILMMWQIYNSYCPLFLKDLLTSHLGAGDYSYYVGLIMAADNVFALFMLPLFGFLSDKTKTSLGKRIPYIIGGTILTAIAFPFIPFLYLKNNFAGVAVLMGIVLLAMNCYRNPAISLMPDVTPKPLRSKANAVINFVGYVGAIFAGIIALLFTDRTSTSIVWPFIITSVFMLAALIILIVKINENKLHQQLEEEMKKGEEFSEAIEKVEEDKPLSNANKRNLIVLISSVFLWFFAFNAIETFWTTYCQFYLGISSWSIAIIVMTISAIGGFALGGLITTKLGRKNVILLGLIIMIVSLILAFILGELMPKNTGSIPWQFYLAIVLFALCGIGWAFINVNSYPMVVEMSNRSNIGKYTGYYYVASMLAQSITPVIIGFVMAFLGYSMFFVYGAVFMTIAMIVFFFVKTKKKKNNLD